MILSIWDYFNFNSVLLIMAFCEDAIDKCSPIEQGGKILIQTIVISFSQISVSRCFRNGD